MAGCVAALCFTMVLRWSGFWLFGVWGGVGMLPFLELALMVDATPCLGFGVGWGEKMASGHIALERC